MYIYYGLWFVVVVAGVLSSTGVSTSNLRNVIPMAVRQPTPQPTIPSFASQEMSRNSSKDRYYSFQITRIDDGKENRTGLLDNNSAMSGENYIERNESSSKGSAAATTERATYNSTTAPPTRHDETFASAPTTAQQTTSARIPNSTPTSTTGQEAYPSPVPTTTQAKTTNNLPTTTAVITNSTLTYPGQRQNQRHFVVFNYTAISNTTFPDAAHQDSVFSQHQLWIIGGISAGTAVVVAIIVCLLIYLICWKYRRQLVLGNCKGSQSSF